MERISALDLLDSLDCMALLTSLHSIRLLGALDCWTPLDQRIRLGAFSH
jgi:hypothetical protein